MKTYLVSLTRNDADQHYPFQLKAKSLNMAIAIAVSRSLKHKPANGKAAFCMVNAYEMRDKENTKY